MHIVLIIASLEPGGAERVLSELANYWANSARKITIITFAASDHQPFYPLDPVINLIQLNQSFQTASFVKRFINIFKRLYYLRKKIKSVQPDIILSFIDVTNITTLIAITGLKIPVVVSERTHPAYYQLPLLYCKLRKIFYLQAAKVVLQTLSSATFFPKLDNLSIIPNAVKPPVASKQNLNSKVINIISVGRLCPSKGFDTLIRAFEKLQKANSGLRLTIYGEGKERSSLECFIKSLDLQSRISMPGAIRNLQNLLPEADLFIFPSHYEGFPNALCEAMAAGLPVIASDCPGNIDVVQDGIDGRLFPVGNIEKLVEIAQELICDPGQRQKISENAQKITERFSTGTVYSLWDQTLKEAIFNKAIKNG